MGFGYFQQKARSRMSRRRIKQGHAIIIKQLWSKCRLYIVFPKRIKIEMQLFMGWEALTLLIIMLSFVVSSDVDPNHNCLIIITCLCKIYFILFSNRKRSYLTQFLTLTTAAIIIN